MNRPRPHVNAENLAESLRTHLEQNLSRFSELAGVVGVTLNGGLARGYADHLSEIDVTIFLTSSAFSSWNRNGSPIATGITVLEGQLYDVKHVSIAAEKARDWDHDTEWDASYAEILYDPKGEIDSLFRKKLRGRTGTGAAEGLLMSCWWYCELAAEIWIHRSDPLQGHHMLNQAIAPLVEALFLSNSEYIPHEKWLLHMSRDLPWKPEDWDERIEASMVTADVSLESVRDRQGIIRTLSQDIDNHLREVFHPELPVRMMQKSTYEQLKWLVTNGEVSVADWRSHTGGDVPSGDPFHPLMRVEGDRIIIDQDALLRLGPDDMYQWHYAVLEAVRGEQREGKTR